MRKPKTRVMTLELSCKRKGTPTHGIKVQWNELEENALKIYLKLYDGVQALLKDTDAWKGIEL